MRFSQKISTVILAAACAAPIMAQWESSESAPPPSTTAAAPEKKRHVQHWWERRRPAADNPTAQLQYAEQLERAGDLRGAARHYRILTFAWPQAPEAPQAQFRYAAILQQRGKAQKAFDEYQYLLDTYAGFFPYDEIIARQYAIADHEATRQRRLIFYTYRDESSALPMFEQIIANAPNGKYAQELQFRVARIHEKNEDYDLAIDAYEVFRARYPLSPQAEAAAFSYARCWHHYACKNPVDAGLRAQAVLAQELFLNTYPQSAMAESVRSFLQELRGAQAEYLYQQARLYDGTARRTRPVDERKTIANAAELCYRRVLREFPDSPWSTMARTRLTHLEELIPVTTTPEGK